MDQAPERQSMGGIALVLLMAAVGAGCGSGAGAGPVDGAASGGAGGAGTGGGAGDAGGAFCGCGGDLVVDLDGDGETLHLTSADFTADGRSDLPFADLLTKRSDLTTVPACMTAPRPWMESTTGEGSVVYWIQACAGPGSAPPCVWLNGNARNPSSLGCLYLDRTGTAIRGYITALDSSFVSFATPLSQTIEGTFTMSLEDGRMLTAHFRACLLASINFA